MAKNEHSVSPVARNVIDKCGGEKIVAGLIGRSLSTVYKWTYPREQGGTGGWVPTVAQKKLMEAARRGEVDLAPADFFENV